LCGAADSTVRGVRAMLIDSRSAVHKTGARRR
jgi:hypothetical protein